MAEILEPDVEWRSEDVADPASWIGHLSTEEIAEVNAAVNHARTAYVHDRGSGKVRHLKRLWLETDMLTERPSWFQNRETEHWTRNKTISRLDAAE